MLNAIKHLFRRHVLLTNCTKMERKDWDLLFSQSRVNGAPYYGDSLSDYRWTFPGDTWLRRRMREKAGEK